MAKFHGFEIKNMKTFLGMEGYGTQGDVWLNGKKLGFWSNDGDGGEDRFEMPRDAVQALNELCAEQCPECAIDSYGMHIDADLSLVLSHLADLKDLEKDWKKLNKQGSSLVVLKSRETDDSVCYSLRTTDRGAILRWLIDKLPAECEKHGLGDGAFDIYDSPESFVVGDPLEGADGAIKRCVEWCAEREELCAKIAAKNKNVA